MDQIDQQGSLKLKDKNGKQIECDRRLLEFSQVLRESPDLEDVIPCTLHDETLLRKIINFYEIYQYDQKEFQTEEFKKKITSDKLKDNLPQKCLDYLKDWILDDSKVDIEKMKDITEACYHYDFRELKECLLKAIGTDFWCGTSDKDMEDYKKKFDLPNEIPAEEQLRIMTVEFKDTFDRLNQRLQEELRKAEPGLVEADQQQQQNDQDQ